MSDLKHISGGVQTPALAHVSADQVTILGDGTSTNPLRLAQSSTMFVDGYYVEASFPSPATPLVGMAVSATGPDAFTFAVSLSVGDNAPTGVISAILPDDETLIPRIRVILSGPLTLTVEQWEAGAGLVGGLPVALPVYLSDVTPGQMTPTPPSDPGTSIAQIGVGLSSTLLLLNPTVLGAVN